MIKNFSKIQNLGVFSNYSGSNDLDKFERFNLFYGLNGSGKTTLSRLFSGLNVGELEEYSDLKYKFDSDSGVFQNGQKFLRNIRVFNSDYVEANIGKIDGQLNPIFIIGEENKTLVSQIKKDEERLSKLEFELLLKTGELEKIEKARGKSFTDVAKIIASDTSGVATRNYRKPEAQKAFSSLTVLRTYTDAEIAVAKKTLQQTPLGYIEEANLQEYVLQSGDTTSSYSVLDAVKELSKFALDVCAETSISQVIQRLENNSDISSWVENGVVLHETHDSDTCEYCLQLIPKNRLEELASHFNQSDNLLKEKIESGISDLNAISAELSLVTYTAKSEFYDELRSDYQVASEECKKSIKELVKHISKLSKILDDKLKQRTEIVNPEVDVFDDENYLNAFGELNRIIQMHNKKSTDFDEEVTKARSRIETHHLSSIKTEIDDVDKNIETLTCTIETITEGDLSTGELGIKELTKSISENRQKVSNAHKGAANLTKLLQTFLGRDDLKFEAEGEGYKIVRDGRVAKRISEGEKTAITFIYFIVQLGDQDFDVNEGIVVIDDPVSSLDAGSVYQAFSFLKNTVKDAKQIFLLTHSFDFLKLLLNWYKNIPKGEGKKSYYMLLCEVDEYGKRFAKIMKLDNELLYNENEYSFLFKTLYKFESDGTISNSYHIPNIARKVLETFLDFHYPETLSMYRKLEKIEFDAKKKTALLKFSNDLSHPTGKGFDPALVPETQKNVQYLLEMIKSVSPVHYETLKNSIESA